MTSPHITIADVIAEVSAFFGFRPLRERSRRRQYVRARFIGMVLARELTGKSTPIIGRAFGYTDHSTLFHALNLVLEPEYVAAMDIIRARLLAKHGGAQEVTQT